MSYQFFILTSHLSDLRPLLLDHLVDFVDRRHIYQDSGWRGNCCKDLSCNNKINPDNVSSSTLSVCVCIVLDMARESYMVNRQIVPTVNFLFYSNLIHYS